MAADCDYRHSDNVIDFHARTCVALSNFFMNDILHASTNTSCLLTIGIDVAMGQMFPGPIPYQNEFVCQDEVKFLQVNDF
jgi:hypothetical protein